MSVTVTGNSDSKDKNHLIKQKLINRNKLIKNKSYRPKVSIKGNNTSKKMKLIKKYKIKLINNLKIQKIKPLQIFLNAKLSACA